jgi:8-oxo-dGTP diphosphatase
MKFEFSAGGIVFKKTPKHTYILIAKHSGHHGWIFPKGHINRGETKEQAALREVKEETGITGAIKQPFAPVTYWFVMNQEKIKKTVYYFLMEYVSGETTHHDFEMEEVAWLLLDEVAERLTYPSDKKAWNEARLTM